MVHESPNPTEVDMIGTTEVRRVAGHMGAETHVAGASPRESRRIPGSAIIAGRRSGTESLVAA